MDNTNCTAQRVRTGSQFNDDHVGGCCLIFKRPRRRNVHRHPIFRPRPRERASRKVLPKGDERKSPEGLGREAIDSAGTLTHRDTEVLPTTPSAPFADVETKEMRSTLNGAIIALNKTISQFYHTFEEFFESGNASEAVRIRDVLVGSASLDEGIELVSRIIQKVIGEQKQANDAMSLERGVLATIGRGLIILCRGLKPALKNFLAVAEHSASVSHAIKD